MKLLTYIVGKKQMLGVLNQEETWVYPISAAGMDYTDMKDLIREIGPSEMEMLAYILKKEPHDVPGAAPMADVKVLSPIPNPDQDIICLGINYAAHAEESLRFSKDSFAKDRKDQAIYFSKRVNRAVDPDGGVCAHSDMTSQLDYEAELVVVIKKDRLIPRMEAPKYVGAVCETAGQFAYIYAIADTEHLAMSAPIISAYCAASVLWSRIFLKEKLSRKHYLMILLVVIGIAIMGFLDM